MHNYYAVLYSAVQCLLACSAAPYPFELARQFLRVTHGYVRNRTKGNPHFRCAAPARITLQNRLLFTKGSQVVRIRRSGKTIGNALFFLRFESLI